MIKKLIEGQIYKYSNIDSVESRVFEVIFIAKKHKKYKETWINKVLITSHPELYNNGDNFGIGKYDFCNIKKLNNQFQIENFV